MHYSIFRTSERHKREKILQFTITSIKWKLLQGIPWVASFLSVINVGRPQPGSATIPLPELTCTSVRVLFIPLGLSSPWFQAPILTPNPDDCFAVGPTITEDTDLIFNCHTWWNCLKMQEENYNLSVPYKNRFLNILLLEYTLLYSRRS